MAPPDTLEDIFNLFQRSQEEIKQRRLKYDRYKQESDRRIAETERQRAAYRAETDRYIAQMRGQNDRHRAEILEMITALDNTVPRLSTRWKRFIINIIVPAMLDLLEAQGFEVQSIYQQLQSFREAQTLEIDLLFMTANEIAIVVEVVSRLTEYEIHQTLCKLRQFKQALPLYAHYQVYGAVVATEIDPDMDCYADQQGLWVIQQTGHKVKILKVKIHPGNQV